MGYQVCFRSIKDRSRTITIEHLDLANCHPAGRQSIDGPNWKIAYDGYLDYYHLPILHKDSFGPDMSTKAIYDAWGPHQHVTAPDRHFAALAEKSETAWEIDELVGGVWTIFPHTSIAGFDVDHTKVSVIPHGAATPSGRMLSR